MRFKLARARLPKGGWNKYLCAAQNPGKGACITTDRVGSSGLKMELLVYVQL